MTSSADWKGMDDFALGIDGNRLPSTHALIGKSFRIEQVDQPDLELRFDTADLCTWTVGDREGRDPYDAVAVRADVYYIALTYRVESLAADVFVINTSTGRTLAIHSQIAPEATPGRPQVSQRFTVGNLKGVDLSGAIAAESRDLIGLRALYHYSPNHLYEHVYLSSTRYAWQCLVGEQLGHSDVDLATTYGLGDNLYVFTFREFLIPVAATWLYDFSAMRSTGTFFGLGATGAVQSVPGGAFITELGRVSYPTQQPV